jgi:hypothetical protein
MSVYESLTFRQKAARVEATRRWRAKQPKKEPSKGLKPGSPEFKARAAANSRKWYAAHKAVQQSRVRVRQARKRSQPCDCCQTEDAKVNLDVTYDIARRLRMEVDHVRPLAKGGKHCLHNLQLLTQTENRRKSAKWQEAA